MEVRLRIDEVLREKHLTKRELAARLGVSDQYLGKVVNMKKSASLRMLAKIAESLGVEVADLIARN